MKIAIRIVAGIVVLVIGALVALYFSLNGIVKSQVQTQATEQLKVATTLGSVDLGLFGGTLGLKNLAIASPPGFSAPQMLSVAGLKVDTGGLMKLRNEPIHISTIELDGTQMVVEQKGQKFNFKALIDGLPKNPEKTTTPSTPTTSKPIRLIIDTITISNAHVLLQADIAGIKKRFDVTIPTTSIKDLGNADGQQKGVELKDVATTILSQLASQASKSAGIPVDVQALLSGNLDGVKDKLTETAKKQLNSVKLPDQVGGLLKSIGGGH